MSKWNNYAFILLILFLSVFKMTSSQEVVAGQVLPQWSEGCLDIHHINTGKGESSFIIMPDGTTMLIDAGVTTAVKPRVTDAKPNAGKSPGEWISRYILHFMQQVPARKLNYVVATHFHEDHLGGITPEVNDAKSGAYKLSGIAEVAEFIPIDKIIDRGWPGYDWPATPPGKAASNYINFVKWQVENGNVKAENFNVGVNDQIKLTNKPLSYPEFEVRNIAANGRVWTGVKSVSKNYFPEMKDVQKQDYPNENACSIAFRISYGKFDYFTGGDLYSVTTHKWQDIETPVGWVTGPVEVCKANHHANFDTMGEAFLQALCPRVIIIQTWLAQQPDMVVLRRMLSTKTYPGPRDVFATNIMEETKIVIGSSVDKLKSQQGHVVVRVNPGGDSYRVYVLDDSEESFKVKAVFGPYSCQ